jgi:hypothetical protein
MFFTEAVLATNYETLFAAWYVWIEREKREGVREREQSMRYSFATSNE